MIRFRLDPKVDWGAVQYHCSAAGTCLSAQCSPGALSLTLVSWTRDLKDFQNDTPRFPSKEPFWSGLSPWQLFGSGSCPSNEIFTPQTTQTIPHLQRRWERDESGRSWERSAKLLTLPEMVSSNTKWGNHPHLGDHCPHGANPYFQVHDWK